MSYRDLLFGDVRSSAASSSAKNCGNCRRVCTRSPDGMYVLRSTCSGCAGTGGLAGIEDDRGTVRQVQTALANLARQYDPGDPMYTGLNPGKIDGIYGKDTRKAVSVFQGAKGLKASGELDAPTLQALGLSAPAAGPASPPPSTSVTPGPFAPPPPSSDSNAGWIAAGAGAAALLGLLWKRRRRPR